MWDMRLFLCTMPTPKSRNYLHPPHCPNLGNAEGALISCLLQLVDKGPELVDDGIVAELPDTIAAPTECFAVGDSTGMCRTRTDIGDIGEWCAIGQDDFDGVVPIDGGAITELTLVVEPPAPGLPTDDSAGMRNACVYGCYPGQRDTSTLEYLYCEWTSEHCAITELTLVI